MSYLAYVPTGEPMPSGDSIKINLQEVKDSVFPESLLKNPNLTLGDIISVLIPYAYALAGIILFVLLILGGFSYLTSGGDPKKVEMAQGKITHALMGFLIIFLAYWLAQLLEIIFGIQIF